MRTGAVYFKKSDYEDEESLAKAIIERGEDSYMVKYIHTLDHGYIVVYEKSE